MELSLALCTYTFTDLEISTVYMFVDCNISTVYKFADLKINILCTCVEISRSALALCIYMFTDFAIGNVYTEISFLYKYYLKGHEIGNVCVFSVQSIVQLQTIDNAYISTVTYTRISRVYIRLLVVTSLQSSPAYN